MSSLNTLPAPWRIHTRLRQPHLGLGGGWALTVCVRRTDYRVQLLKEAEPHRTWGPFATQDAAMRAGEVLLLGAMSKVLSTGVFDGDALFDLESVAMSPWTMAAVAKIPGVAT